MSDFEGMSPPSGPSGRALDAVVEEAKVHLDVPAEMDWTRLESRVMASVEAEKPALLRDTQRRSRSSRLATGGLLLLAAAAAVAVFVRRDHERDVALTDVASSVHESVSASALRSTEGTGEVRIGDLVGTPGHVVRAGDALDVDGVRAVFERTRKVSWLLEQDRAPNDEPRRGVAARARVKSAGESLVLALENGVIEAQVTPVPTGEAFAVDVATERGLVRVAVHGTHLRVARAGNRVVVDLTEGVVAIGVPPRIGMTTGTIVTAPAHVELDANDLSTLRVDHTPALVRAAVPLGAHETAMLATARPEPLVAAEAPLAPATPPAVKPVHVESPAPSANVDPPKAARPARETIAAAVRECAATRSQPGDVHVTVSSSLRLRVSSTGTVETAQFSPPLLPDIQSCAAQTIYKTPLDETGLVVIPIEFAY